MAVDMMKKLLIRVRFMLSFLDKSLQDYAFEYSKLNDEQKNKLASLLSN